jgi:hypothetical protein
MMTDLPTALALPHARVERDSSVSPNKSLERTREE